MIEVNLNVLANKCGSAAYENGWHDRYLKLKGEKNKEAIVDHLVAKTALVANEVAEAIEELRNGHTYNETYYKIAGDRVYPVRDNGGADWTTDSSGSSCGITYTGVLAKPEGYPSELADVIIRALDIAYMLNIDIDKIVNQKLEYNATRGQMHGGKKI